MKTILVPTDFSENARLALSCAATIAKAAEAELVVLHAYTILSPDPLYPQGMYDTLAESISQEAHDRLKAYEAEVKPALSVPCRFESKMGLVADVIRREAKSYHADLIVMGTKGASGVLDNLLGSITSAVIESHEFPVLTIPMGTQFNGLRTIVFGTDYREIRNPLTIRPLTDLARAFLSKIHIINATPVPESVGVEYTGEEQLERLLQDYEVCFDYTDEPDIEKALRDCVRQEKASLLVLIAHRRGFWKGLFHHSVTRSMALHSQVPVLVLPDLP
jgi:nucleotide-binding universal stress UspA family protein